MSSHADPLADPLGVPSAWVRRFAHLVQAGGRVLDVAAGGGRHSRFFAGRKHPVVALDRVLDGMADLADDARVTPIQCDLEAAPWPLEGELFAGIVVTHYLHRPLLPRLIASLAPGGVLIYETFAQGNERFGRPTDPRFLLAPNELLDACAGALTIVGYEHGISYAPRPAMMQRLAAVATREPVPL